MVVPTVWPLVLTLGRGGGGGGGGGAACAGFAGGFSAGLSTTGLASGAFAGGAAGMLFDETEVTAMADLASCRDPILPQLPQSFHVASNLLDCSRPGPDKRTGTPLKRSRPR